MTQHQQASASICTATRRDGQRCTLPALAGGRCFAHSPEAMEARRRGGEGRATARRLLHYNPPELRQTLQRLVRALE